jgi:hypothetical protein
MLTDDKRLRRVLKFKLGENYGDHLRYAVFECDLNPGWSAGICVRSESAWDPAGTPDADSVSGPNADRAAGPMEHGDGNRGGRRRLLLLEGTGCPAWTESAGQNEDGCRSRRLG